MSEALLQIANGLKMMAAGYEALASKEQNISINTEASITNKHEPPKKEVKNVSVEEVRAVLATKTRDGKTQQVKALLNEFGADKLSGVPENKLAELKEQAEVL
jgi:hypothetical protein